MNISKIAKDHETAWIGEAELATRAPSAPLEADASWNHLEEVESAHSTKLFCPQALRCNMVQPRTAQDRSKQKQNTIEYYFLYFFPSHGHMCRVCNMQLR